MRGSGLRLGSGGGWPHSASAQDPGPQDELWTRPRPLLHAWDAPAALKRHALTQKLKTHTQGTHGTAQSEVLPPAACAALREHALTSTRVGHTQPPAPVASVRALALGRCRLCVPQAAKRSFGRGRRGCKE